MAQLDFVLEMAAKDDPDKWTFTRAGTVQASESMTRWVDKLAGRILTQFLMITGLTASIEAAAKWRAKRSAPPSTGLKPGMSRGGKDLKGASNPN
jgi:hypothetical protein